VIIELILRQSTQFCLFYSKIFSQMFKESATCSSLHDISYALDNFPLDDALIAVPSAFLDGHVEALVKETRPPVRFSPEPSILSHPVQT
jgi:hypothetical protein